MSWISLFSLIHLHIVPIVVVIIKSHNIVVPFLLRDHLGDVLTCQKGVAARIACLLNHAVVFLVKEVRLGLALHSASISIVACLCLWRDLFLHIWLG